MPVSHITVTMVAPGFKRSASLKDAATLAPVEVPANRPSSRVSRNAIATASAVDTRSIRSASFACQSGTT